VPFELGLCHAPEKLEKTKHSRLLPAFSGKK